jgi:hypothetical protein
MAVLLVLPGFASPEGVFLFEIRVALDGFPLLPWEFEVDVLELIVETSLAGVRKRRVPKYTQSMRPVNCAHAHRAGSAVHVEIAAFEHLRPFRNGVGRVNLPAGESSRELRHNYPS